MGVETVKQYHWSSDPSHPRGENDLNRQGHCHGIGPQTIHVNRQAISLVLRLGGENDRAGLSTSRLANMGTRNSRKKQTSGTADSSSPAPKTNSGSTASEDSNPVATEPSAAPAAVEENIQDGFRRALDEFFGQDLAAVGGDVDKFSSELVAIFEKFPLPSSETVDILEEFTKEHLFSKISIGGFEHLIVEASRVFMSKGAATQVLLQAAISSKEAEVIRGILSAADKPAVSFVATTLKAYVQRSEHPSDWLMDLFADVVRESSGDGTKANPFVSGKEVSLPFDLKTWLLWYACRVIPKKHLNKASDTDWAKDPRISYVSSLLKAGADPNASFGSKPESALSIAVDARCFALVSVLSNADGCDPLSARGRPNVYTVRVM